MSSRPATPHGSTPRHDTGGRQHRRLASENPRFFTIGQVAELLEVSTRTVRRWIDAELLVTHRVGGVVRIAKRDLLAFLADHREG